MNSSSRRAFFKKAITAGAAFAPLTSAFGKSYETAIEHTPKSSAPADLKIENVKCGFIRNGNSLFVKITTNQGITGQGEAVDAVAGSYHLVKRFEFGLKGKSPLNVHRLFEDIRRSGVFAGAQSGMYVAVLSAIETALWDLAGKALGIPVYQLLGGEIQGSNSCVL